MWHQEKKVPQTFSVASFCGSESAPRIPDQTNLAPKVAKRAMVLPRVLRRVLCKVVCKVLCRVRCCGCCGCLRAVAAFQTGVAKSGKGAVQAAVQGFGV